MGTGKTYSTKYLLDSNNSSGVAGQVLSTTSTGIDWVDANTVPGTGLWLANGNDIYNSNSGNVGIGTTSPDAKLVIEDDSNVVYDDSAYQKTFRIEKKNNQGSNQFANIRFNVTGYEGQTTAEASIGVVQTSNASSGNLVFGTRNDGTRSEKMRINSDGNVGIGTTSPDAKLDIEAAINPTIRLTNSTDPLGSADVGTLEFFTKDSSTAASRVLSSIVCVNSAASPSVPDGQLIFKTSVGGGGAVAATEKMRISSAGNVGINVTNPGIKLQLVSADEQLTNFSSSVADQLAYSQINSSSSTTGTITAAAALELVGQANASGHGRHVWIGAEGTPNTTFKTKLKFKVRGETASGYDWAGSSEAPTIMTLEGDGNVGIGTDSPLTKLHIAGATDANIIRIENTVTSLSLGSTIGAIQFFNNDITDDSPNVAASIYATAGASGGSGSLRFKTTEPGTEGDPATDTMIITNGGRVGIGTTSPSSILELAATTPILTLNSTAVNVAQGIEWRNSGTLDAYIKQGPSTAEFEFNVGRNTTWGGDFKFVTDTYDAYRITRDQHKFFILGSAKMTITSAGNVGIGTTSPASKLEVNGNVTISEKIIHAGDTDTFLKFNSSGWEFQSSGGPTTDISASSGVTSIYGKGTEAIQVGSSQIANFLGPIYATNSLTAALNPIAASGGTKGLPAYSFISDTNTGMYSDTADQLEFVTGGNVGMVIDSSSNVGIGTNGPGNKLEVTGIIEATVGDTGGFAYGADPASKQGLMISVSNTGGDAFSGAGRIENTSTTNSSSAVLVLRQTNSASFSTITQYRQGSGTQGNLVGFVRVTTTNTIFSTSGSDERLKKNITNWTDDTLGKFKALQPKKFRYKIQDASEEKTLGFIAQNEVANFPEAYVLNKENEDDDAMYSFNPMGMTTHLMKAIKDLVEKVEILENKITQLEN